MLAYANSNGRTPLHFSAQDGHLAIVNIIIDTCMEYPSVRKKARDFVVEFLAKPSTDDFAVNCFYSAVYKGNLLHLLYHITRILYLILFVHPLVFVHHPLIHSSFLITLSYPLTYTKVIPTYVYDYYIWPMICYPLKAPKSLHVH